jgi:hypothetical protein
MLQKTAASYFSAVLTRYMSWIRAIRDVQPEFPGPTEDDLIRSNSSIATNDDWYADLLQKAQTKNKPRNLLSWKELTMAPENRRAITVVKESLYNCISLGAIETLGLVHAINALL